MAIVLFLLVLFVLVLVHEWGHFIAAKKTGMRVDEFGIGFPPKLFGVKRGETLYSFNALPLGGFVKIFGEDAIDVEGSADRERSFIAKSKWKQVVVLIAGVTMNVFFAWLLFSFALAFGVQSVVSEEDATENAKLVVTEVLVDGPAAEANLPRSVIVTSVRTGGEELNAYTPSSFSTFIAERENEEVEISYTRGGETYTTTVVPQSEVIESDASRVAIGVALALTDVVQKPIHVAFVDGFMLTMRSLRDIAVGIAMLLGDVVRLSADFSQVAGPVGIVGLVGEASAFGLSSLLMFTAFISLNLAVINLLPFPALDGGRLLFVVIEVIKGSPIKPSYAYALNFIGFALILLLMFIVTVSDVSKII